MLTDDKVAVDRRLTGKPAAVALVVGMLAVPGIPMFLALGSEDSEVWASGENAKLATDSGQIISTMPPPGWQVTPGPGVLTWQSGGAVVRLEVHDLDGRDVAAVGQRLMRLDRVRGFSPAYDGGAATSGDGSLTGQTCVVTGEGLSGTCAVIADDDVVVYVQTLGDVADPALALDDVLGAISRADS